MVISGIARHPNSLNEFAGDVGLVEDVSIEREPGPMPDEDRLNARIDRVDVVTLIESQGGDDDCACPELSQP